MTDREKRVINSFINLVERGEYTYDYAVSYMENDLGFGYLTKAAKDVFYKKFDALQPPELENLGTPTEEEIVMDTPTIIPEILDETTPATKETAPEKDKVQ